MAGSGHRQSGGIDAFKRGGGNGSLSYFLLEAAARLKFGYGRIHINRVNASWRVTTSC
ncbi:hypothetical protein [Pseudomonas helleri]|uniref:Uncharacterized protein n=1 Tax=Pseudomonas helleri TaxID=1608996 RepID=A0A7X2C2C1_9PSED|nr:hypothetical protein [Pseudomonas helleri]MQT88027.1 hypothetical protein [Pseudomonas helleri]